jgi:DNA invertase Pin-like site-specific DNA recombinase
VKAAYGYLRVSSAGQAKDDRDGLVRQRQAIKKWAQANDVYIAKWFEDSVRGTKDLEDRPALQSLILHANGVKLIVFERLDRLARDLMIQESILADFKRNGFEVISTCEPDLCSEDPTRVLVRQILGAFSQYERAMIVQKLKGARERARLKNPDYKEGRKFFGDRPGEPETIQLVIELRASGMTLPAICTALTAEGRMTRSGGAWFPTHISRILAKAKLG